MLPETLEDGEPAATIDSRGSFVRVAGAGGRLSEAVLLCARHAGARGWHCLLIDITLGGWVATSTMASLATCWSSSTGGMPVVLLADTIAADALMAATDILSPLGVVVGATVDQRRAEDLAARFASIWSAWPPMGSGGHPVPSATAPKPAAADLAGWSRIDPPGRASLH